MKKLILTTALLVAASAAPALAQTSQLNSFLTNQATQMGQSYVQSATTQTTTQTTSSGMTVQQFNAMKSQALGRLNNKIGHLQSEERCAQNAQTPESVHSCAPDGFPPTTSATSQATTNAENQGINSMTQYGTQYLHH